MKTLTGQLFSSKFLACQTVSHFSGWRASRIVFPTVVFFPPHISHSQLACTSLRGRSIIRPAGDMAPILFLCGPANHTTHAVALLRLLDPPGRAARRGCCDADRRRKRDSPPTVPLCTAEMVYLSVADGLFKKDAGGKPGRYVCVWLSTRKYQM